MDLLVRIANEKNFSPVGLALKIPIAQAPGFLPYKPNTPIGKIGPSLVEVVPKADVAELPKKQLPRTANQPFEVQKNFLINLLRNEKICMQYMIYKYCIYCV